MSPTREEISKRIPAQKGQKPEPGFLSFPKSSWYAPQLMRIPKMPRIMLLILSLLIVEKRNE
jgi:hypothetical protein